MVRAGRGNKRAADGSVITQIVLPAFKIPAGDRIAQESADDEHEALSEIVNLLYEHRTHCHHMLSHLRKRLKTEEEEKEMQQGLVDLVGASTWGTVLVNDMAAMKSLSKHSDLTAQDLAKVKAMDNDGLKQLMTLAAQLTKTHRVG